MIFYVVPKLQQLAAENSWMHNIVKIEKCKDSLELGDEHSERQLEQAALARIEPFLREMGGLFSLIDMLNGLKRRQTKFGQSSIKIS